MRHISLLITICICVIFFGCSKTDVTNPVSIPDVQAGNSEQVILGAGTMNLETGETTPQRDMSGYMDVTPFLGSNFQWNLEHDEEDWYILELYLNNPSVITVHDVLLVFDNLYGKEGYGDGTKADEVEGDLGDFSSEEFQAQTDGELFYKTTIGRDDMQEYTKKMPDDEDRWLIVNYMRTLVE